MNNKIYKLVNGVSADGKTTVVEISSVDIVARSVGISSYVEVAAVVPPASVLLVSLDPSNVDE